MIISKIKTLFQAAKDQNCLQNKYISVNPKGQSVEIALKTEAKLDKFKQKRQSIDKSLLVR